MSRVVRFGSVAAAVGVALALGGTAPATATTTVMCGGQVATIVGHEYGEGLSGTDGDDVIAGLGGTDYIHGNNGNDIICGGAGNLNELDGDEGNDILIMETPGTVTGGEGDDTFDASRAPAGLVLVSYSLAGQGVTVDLRSGTATGEGIDTLVGVSAVTGSTFGDQLTGDSLDNVFYALSSESGVDVVTGGAGDDTLAGNDGNDEIKGGRGADNLYGGLDDDTYRGGAGRDFLYESSTDNGDDELFAGGGADYLYGGVGDDFGDAGGGVDSCNADIEAQVDCEESSTGTPAAHRSAVPPGDPWGWGRNYDGEVGDGCEWGEQRSPSRVDNLAGVTMIAGSAALAADGQVWAWGNNDYGQIGDGTTWMRCEPVPVPRMDDVVSIATEGTNKFAVTADGRLWGWGRNESGQVGDGTTAERHRPVRTKHLKNVVAVDAGADHVLALTANGTVKAWGANNYGELGDGTTEPQLRPQTVPGLSDVIAISAGGHTVTNDEPYAGFNLVLKADGTVWGWGSNDYGQLGDGTVVGRLVPTQILELVDVAAVSAGNTHSLALLTDGTVRAWGDNFYGQLGDGTQGDSHTPQLVPGLEDFTLVDAGYRTSLAVRADGIAFGWGDNSFGQVGNGVRSQKELEPAQVVTLTGVTAIDQDAEASFAIADSD